MNSASPKIILERLREEWLEVIDAAMYRELELEKQLWVLAALHRLKLAKDASTIDHRKETTPEDSIYSIKVLSLYQNCGELEQFASRMAQADRTGACSSFLSAQNPQPIIHHLSTSPISSESFPNIHSLCVSSPNSQLPYASNFFSSIHAFSLPAVLPASLIPTMLKECYRTLVSASKMEQVSPTTSSASFPLFENASTPLRSNPIVRAGVIHLTILDPAPVHGTLGPLLHDWLDDHLILNLERQFRCINPSRLFPLWLSDAGLRGEGSTIVTIRFLANINDEKLEITDSTDCSVKTQLKSVVGRMLWKEMWGPFVEGNKWWWEDDNILSECQEKGTCWEYAVVEGMKA